MVRNAGAAVVAAAVGLAMGCGSHGEPWTGGLVVGRGPLGPESKAPNTIGSSCPDDLAFAVAR